MEVKEEAVEMTKEVISEPRDQVVSEPDEIITEEIIEEEVVVDSNHEVEVRMAEPAPMSSRRAAPRPR